MSAHVKKGTVKWFNTIKGFGVIESKETKEECFFFKNRVYTDSIPLAGDETYYFPSMGKKGLTAEAVYLEKDFYGEIIIFSKEGKQSWNLVPEGFYACSVNADIYNLTNLETQVNYVMIPNYVSRVGTKRFFGTCPKNWANGKEIITKEHGNAPYHFTENYVKYKNQLVRADDFDVKYIDDLAKWREEVTVATNNLKERIYAFVAENSSFCIFSPTNEGTHLFLKEYNFSSVYSFDNDIIIVNDEDEDDSYYDHIFTTKSESMINHFISKYTNELSRFREEAKTLGLSSENVPRLYGFIFDGVKYNIDPA